MAMARLNSGIFRIFRLGAWNLNLNNSDCRASKIISNNTKLEAIPRELDVENPLFSFCVGVWGTVCDKLFICIKRCVRKFHIFWYQCRPGGRWRKYGFEWKTDQKSEITGVEIAWVEEKSNSYPLYYIRKWPAWKILTKIPNKNFKIDFPGNWISFNFLKRKKMPTQKIYSDI